MAVDLKGTEDPILNQYWSSSESASNGFRSSGSSSIDLSTETESDDEDFIAELNRQMADYMLKEEDEVEKVIPNSVSQNSKTSSLQVDDKIIGSVSSSRTLSNHPLQPIQFDCGSMKNSGQVNSGKINEQHFQLKRNPQSGNGERVYPLCLSQSGPGGMRAVFLGGPGSRNAANGTGVFLPRGSQIIPEPRKKKGCPTVLIPARVLETLKHHFHTIDTSKKSNGCGTFTAQPKQQPNSTPSYSDVVVSGTKQKRHIAAKARPTINNEQELQLPKEWTY